MSRKPLSYKAATNAALAAIDTWPGEFTIDEVRKLTYRHMNLRAGSLGELFAAVHRTDENIGGYLFMITEWILMKLRKAQDRYKLRVYVCYKVADQRQRHWVKFDNVTVNVLDALMLDREELARQSARMLMVLARARPLLIRAGPTAKLGDIKASLMDDLAS